MQTLGVCRFAFAVCRWALRTLCGCAACACCHAGVADAGGLAVGKHTIFGNERKTAGSNRFNGKRQTPNETRHDFHSSLAEIHYNAASKSLEVSLRVFSDDLNAALTKASRRPIRVDQTTATDALIKQYLDKHFAFANAKNTRQPAVWVGKEIAVDVTWLYFEIPLTENLNGMRFENSLLCELYEDQVNIVNLNYQKQKRTYLFKADQAVQTVDL